VSCTRLPVLSVGYNVISYIEPLYTVTCFSAVKLLQGALPPVTSLNTVLSAIAWLSHCNLDSDPTFHGRPADGRLFPGPSLPPLDLVCPTIVV
jgi:hypothetical protein